jgi:hypothetical protein
MEKASALFRTADNASTTLVTIRLPRTYDLATIEEKVRILRRRLRVIRDDAARKWDSWCAVRMFGFVEIGVVRESDIWLLPRGLREAVLSYPVDGWSEDGDPVWLPHLHVIVHHKGVARRDLQKVLAKRFPGVHLRAFYLDKTFDENVCKLAGYGLKRTPPVEFEGGWKEEWEVAWKARYYAWLHGMGRGVQRLEVRVGPKRGAEG